MVLLFLAMITVPPDDEGWLCPGCDCKVDCIDLLNDLQGTDLSVTDSWEVVSRSFFPDNQQLGFYDLYDLNCCS